MKGIDLLCKVKDKVWVTIDSKKRHVDCCMIPMIETFKEMEDFESVACCCGHGRYKSSFLARRKGANRVFDMFSGVKLPFTGRYYKRNKGTKRLFFIPEIEAFWDKLGEAIKPAVLEYFRKKFSS